MKWVSPTDDRPYDITFSFDVSHCGVGDVGFLHDLSRLALPDIGLIHHQTVDVPSHLLEILVDIIVDF